eukprot:TRINITY_DN1217_c0_g1_i11.p1 TRINITY_DN1217_c0_g1~~TRINITY_DN1217_c0_g1_i11.p1  ORF type:complete len:181 (-),score=3.95 TRINITY_DN1217_c0_g1_i11:326-868(-)
MQMTQQINDYSSCIQQEEFLGYVQIFFTVNYCFCQIQDLQYKNITLFQTKTLDLVLCNLKQPSNTSKPNVYNKGPTLVWGGQVLFPKFSVATQLQLSTSTQYGSGWGKLNALIWPNFQLMHTAAVSIPNLESYNKSIAPQLFKQLAPVCRSEYSGVFKCERTAFQQSCFGNTKGFVERGQ